MKKVVIGTIAVVVIYYLFVRAKKNKPDLTKLSRLYQENRKATKPFSAERGEIEAKAVKELGKIDNKYDYKNVEWTMDKDGNSYFFDENGKKIILADILGKKR